MFYIYAADIAHKDFNQGVCLAKRINKGDAMRLAKSLHNKCQLIEVMVMDSSDCMLWCSFEANDTVRSA